MKDRGCYMIATIKRTAANCGATLDSVVATLMATRVGMRAVMILKMLLVAAKIAGVMRGEMKKLDEIGTKTNVRRRRGVGTKGVINESVAFRRKRAVSATI